MVDLDTRHLERMGLSKEKAKEAAVMATKALSENTWREYGRHWRAYLAWTKTLGKRAFPVTDDNYTAYLAELSIGVLAKKTVDGKLAPLKYARKPLTTRLPKAIKNERPKGKDTTPRLGFASTYVKQILDSGVQAFKDWQKLKQGPQTRRVASRLKEQIQEHELHMVECLLIVLSYQFILRSMSLTTLQGQHVYFTDTELIMNVKEKWNKTDNDGRARKRLPKRHPVASFLKTLLTHGIVKKENNKTIFQNVIPRESSLVPLLRKILKHLDIKMPRTDENFKYDWHCLRRGGTTACVRIKVDKLQITNLGGWKNEQAMLNYVDQFQESGAYDAFFFGHMLGVMQLNPEHA